MATERDASDMRGPYGGELGTQGLNGKRIQISAVAVTTSSAVIDMQDTNHFADNQYTSHFVRMVCDQNLFYVWSNNASAIIDDAAKDGTNRDRQCDFLPANMPREEVPAGRYLVIKGAAAGTVRLSIVQSYNPGM